MKTKYCIVALLFVALTVSAAPKRKKMQAPTKPPTDKPDVSLIEPRGLQRGIESKIKLTGTNLNGLLQLKIADPKIKGELLPESQRNTEAWIKLTAAADLPRGPYEFSLTNTNGESGKLKIYVD